MRYNIWRITLDTNPEDCNLNCIMCEEHSELSNFKEDLYNKTGVKRRVMPKETIRKILNEASEIGVTEVIPTTMGDPLVTDNFEFIAELVASNKQKLNVTHNGTFPRKPVEEWAAIIVPITNDIKISWNGATPEIAEAIMKGLDYKKAKSNLLKFIKFRDQWYQKTGHFCSVTLQMTFMRSNMHEIESIIKLASEMGIDRIKGHHVWINFLELESKSFLKNTESISDWNGIISEARIAVKKYPKKNGQLVRLENFDTVSDDSFCTVPYHYHCPFLGKELWISATGKISPCCAPDQLRNTLGDFGNISDVTIKQAIDSERYRELVENYKTKNLCKTCKMRKL